MTKKVIRSLTLHLPIKNWSNLSYELEIAHNELEELVEFFKNNTDIEIWTKRLTLSTPPSEISISKIEKMINEIIVDKEKTLVSLGSFSINDKRLEEIKNSLIDGLYAYFRVNDWSELSKIATVLTNWSEPPYEQMTRLGVELLGDPIFVTPYYPLSQTPEIMGYPSISLSFMLPKVFLDLYTRKGIEEVVNYLYRFSIQSLRTLNDFKEVSKKKYNIAGIDLSLSPWMEESVGELVEKIGDCVIGEISCIPTIYFINNIIEKTAKMIPKTTGFNEIMMAVAEDSILKQRVYEKKLSLRGLLEMIPVCLAGLDMIGIRTNQKGLLDLLSTLKAYSETKRKVVGFRAIILPEYYDEEKILSKKFGDIPIIDFV